MKLRIRRKTLWTLAVGAATGLVVLLLILIAIGVLVLPAASPASVTVTEVRWTILQGTTSSGLAWFGQGQFNYTNGFPVNETAGGSMTLSVSLTNLDTLNHTIYSVVAMPPFNVSSVQPAVPRVVPHSVDNALFQITVSVPDDPGRSLVLQLTVNALEPG
jgi:hypothetical protein